MIRDIEDNLDTLSTLADLSNDFFIAVKDGNISYLNSKALKLLKCEGLEYPKLNEILIHNEEGLFLKGPRKLVPVKKREKTIFEGDSKVRLISLRDLYDINKLEDFMEKRCNEYEVFSYRVAHDLKGPLSAARQYLSVITKDQVDIEMLIETLDKSVDIINGLYLLSGLSKHTDFSEVDLNVIVPSLADMLSGFPEYEMDCEHCFYGSPTMALTLLQNLFKNTIDHFKGEDKPKVIISTSKEDDKVILTYEDNGKGIPKEERKSVLEVFYKGSHSEGLGLGMNIISKAVELMHGRMKIKESEELGGVKIIFTFPCLED